MGSKGKSYEELKAECLRLGTLFEDRDFPASSRSLYYTGVASRYIRWKRPGEIVSNPKFVVRSATRFDLNQGALGDCWFIAAAASLAIGDKKIFERCVPLDQSFEDNYAGIFRFRFWRFDHWQDVVIDDRLPTQYGRLMYASNRSEPNEFWAALMEKAYAKLYGCYESIDGGFQQDALVDFTGGISEFLFLGAKNELPPNLDVIITRTFRMNSMLGCSIQASRIREEPLSNGLYKGHAYTITAVAKIRLEGKEELLLRLRNPWGKGEWKGRWSDYSNEWGKLSDGDWEKLGLNPKEDGEFWMSYDDWLREFTDVFFCHLYPDAVTDEAAVDMKKKRWNVKKSHSEWVRGVTAGGCGNPPHQELFWKNPQFSVTLSGRSDADGDGFCTLIISLMEKMVDRRTRISIGFTIYHLKQNQPRRLTSENYDKYSLQFADTSGRYTNHREVCCRYLLEPGTYIIIPATFLPHQESEFLLRLYSEQEIPSGVVDRETGPRPSPRSAEESFIKIFYKHAGEDFLVDASELQQLMNQLIQSENGNAEHIEQLKFSMEASRSLLALMDRNGNGTLGLEEAEKMWKEVKMLIKTFKTFDLNRSGTIDTYELDKMFDSIGFSVSQKVLTVMVRRYGGRRRRMSLDDFIICVTKVMVIYDAYTKHQKGRNDSKAEFTLDEFMAISMAY